MKANESYFRLTRGLYGWFSNYGIRLVWSFPSVNAWTHLILSMGIRRSKRWQWLPVWLHNSRSTKELQIGFGLVHFTITFNY